MNFGGRLGLWLMACGAALIGASISAVAANTLCVNSGGKGKCYKTITAAVGDAMPGDTIRVAPGTYVEGDIVIGKSLSLIGADSRYTIINAAGKRNGIYIDGLDHAGLGAVVVSGFTIKNANFEGILVTNASSVTIADNRVVSNNVKLDPSNQTCPDIPGFETEEGFDCGEGIHLSGVDHSTVAGNLIENNAGGILLSDDTGATHDNLITGNVARNNPYDCGITLASHPLYAGLMSTPRGVDNNTISGNVSTGNGVAVEGAGAGVGLFVAGGGLETAGNVVIGNQLTNNGLPGVAFHLHTPFAGQNLNNNLITGNYIAGNGADTEDAATPGPTGINVFTHAQAAPISGTVIVQNTIKNEQVDIATNNGGVVDAHLNNLLGKFFGKVIGVDNLGAGSVNATVNWWGCPKGPGAPGCTTVAGTDVTFAPWLTAPVSQP
jgi:parallel beta-helix repeat protein